MSDNAQLSPEAAQGVLFDEVYLPSFVDKCAQLGVALPDMESVQAAIETTVMLKSAEAVEEASLVKGAAADFRSALGIRSPEDEKAAEEAAGAAEKQAADRASVDRIRQAVDALAAASK